MVLQNLTVGIVWLKVSVKNHQQLPENILTRQKLSNSLKQKAVDDMFVRPSKILNLSWNVLTLKI